MSLSRPLFAAASIALASTFALPLQAQTAPAGAAAKAPSADLAEAEVRRVDKENKKITLKHGEIKNLDMPPMTMVFGVKDAGLLDKVKAGEKVRFRAVDDGGQLTVTEIQPAK